MAPMTGMPMRTVLHLHAVPPVFTMPVTIAGWLDLAILPHDMTALRKVDIWPLGTDLGVENLRLFVVQILSWIRRLILKHLDESIEPGGQDRPEDWSNPVDPMVTVEFMKDHTWSKGSCRIERSTGVVNTWKGSVSSYVGVMEQ